MYLAIAAFFLGTYLLQYFKALPDWHWLFLALLLLFAFWFIGKNRKFKYCSQIGVGLVLGFGWCLCYSLSIASWSLPFELENKNITITGYVASLPEVKDKYLRFSFATQTVANKKQHARVELTWSSNYSPLKVGDKWQLGVRLKRPHGSMNPGGFDYEQYLFANKIRAIGYVVPVKNENSVNQLLSSKWYHYSLDRFRQRLQIKIANSLGKMPLAGVVTALTIGQRDGITNPQWQTFNNTGTTHLVAISGLHIGLISSSVYFLVSFVWRRFPQLMLRIPAQRAAAFAAIIIAVFYAALAGFCIPTQRALLMVLVFMGFTLGYRCLAPWHAWFIALFIILLINPLSSMVGGFWLSFASVGSLIYAFSGRLRAGGWWWKWGRAQVVVAFGLLPFCLLIFHQLSFTSLFGNMVAIPWVGLVVVPLCLAGSLLTLVSNAAGGFLLLLAEKALEGIWYCLDFLAGQSWGVWHYVFLHDWLFWVAIIGVVLVLAPRGFPARWLGIVWLSPLLLYHPKPLNFGEMKFTLLDVGQGLAAVIQTQNHVLVYDAGPKYSEEFDSGKMEVVPYLQKNGIHQVDVLVVSHGDNDHSGGARAVLGLVKVKSIYTSAPELFSDYSKTANCWAGKKWQWDGVNFEFLGPDPGEQNFKNDASCVLKVCSVLLTGDIEKKEEAELLAEHEANLKSTVLVVPHHGSNSSSGDSFVRAVYPVYALFSDGYLNRFHFPSPKVLARYAAINSQVFNTVVSGAIIMRFNEKQDLAEIIEYRKSASHFWNWTNESQ